MKRSAGILMPIFALPSAHGIGTLGEPAFNFIDFLVEAGQSWWQILPLGPTGFGNSPYQCLSSWAGNPNLIDLPQLAQQGLFCKHELSACVYPKQPQGKIDYQWLRQNKTPRLNQAAQRLWNTEKVEIQRFIDAHPQVQTYAIYAAIKLDQQEKPWFQWNDADLQAYKPKAVTQAIGRLEQEIQVQYTIQYLFFQQWQQLHQYAQKKGIGIIGDLPIYTAHDSADVWSERDMFWLDEKNQPTCFAGVGPDQFSATGQFWGNPLYRWAKMKENGYRWWIERIRGQIDLVDALRLDHFRGFADYWCIPNTAENAADGYWEAGPGLDFVTRIKEWFSGTAFIAEDLGILSEAAKDLLVDSGLPGMKVLQFAFDGDRNNSHLPHQHRQNTICYTGTHDNPTLKQWFSTLTTEQKKNIQKYAGLHPEEGITAGLIRCGMSSVAQIFISQLQDWIPNLTLARTNYPGTQQENWSWQSQESDFTTTLAQKIKEITWRYGR